MCDVLGEQDDKLINFSALLDRLRREQPAGKKVLVFSYYADTIQYLQESLQNYYQRDDLKLVGAFTSGKTKGQIENLAKRFSPSSKGGSDEVKRDGELDILFATDVLSEGQNLQDCGLLVNFDLHWNPVRMIQRNGRINRLGSEHSDVFIYNMHPDVDLEEYLSLVNRLERKIDRIRYTVGTDQSVLGEDANPIEYVDDMENDLAHTTETLALYDDQLASEVLATLDDDSDLLSEDEFISDLRQFERTASADEKSAVMSIPEGKWGLLSRDGAAALGNAQALSLVRVTGRTNASAQDFISHIFVSTTDSVGAVETIEALRSIRAGVSESAKTSDDINLPRARVAKRALQVAVTHTKTVPSFFRLTPSITRVLDALKQASPLTELHEGLRKVSTKQESKRAKSLTDRGNRDLKQMGRLATETISHLEDFAQQMALKPKLEKFVLESGVTGGLHFGR
jgi:superfamily II DNA/RNA helicase